MCVNMRSNQYHSSPLESPPSPTFLNLFHDYRFTDHFDTLTCSSVKYKITDIDCYLAQQKSSEAVKS